jgi:serine phosphatase RsbU (regulator of sigma subunit)/anti-sigma regulatory factor (Ser/Thr protein kinase)
MPGAARPRGGPGQHAGLPDPRQQRQFGHLGAVPGTPCSGAITRHQPDSPQRSGIVSDISGLPSPSSVRTLILGIDPAGRIVQHDRSAPGIFHYEAETLLGVFLTDLVNETGETGSTVSSLLDAVGADREATAVLSLKTKRNCAAEAVVTVQPMQDAGHELAALVIVRLPPPPDEQFLDPALMRHALLDDTFRQIGATLDLDQMARGLANIVVPHFCNAASLLVLESLVGAEDEFSGEPPEGSRLMRRMAIAVDDVDLDWEAAFPTGEVLQYPPDTPYTQCLETGKPVRLGKIDEASATTMADKWLRRPVARLLSSTSKLLLPLNARGATLGFFVCTRRPGFRGFDAYDTQIGMEFAARAAIFIDNARRYNRERATALTLQRSLLPTGLSAPSSVEVGHRYLPGSQLIEVGGDWYESIALPGARVALVVGDVAGHGVRAAVTMGRLRTAIRTLAMLELPPAESLHQLNEIMEAMGNVEPHFATCAYALYDAVAGTCEIASAGHLPPLLVKPDGKSQYLDVAPAPPLGVGDGLVGSETFEIEDGSLLVLYTDGLVESRGQDIDDGLARLRESFTPESATRPVDDLCKSILTGAYADHQRDDIAVLMARLSRINCGHQETWTVPSELTSAGKARSLVREPLERWELDSLLPVTQLLVSELVTNAIRYTEGDVTLRLVLENSLTLEVLDSSPALPRLRHAARDDERGRGLQIVSQLSHRWGARRTPSGKVVWCEQLLPEAAGEAEAGEDAAAVAAVAEAIAQETAAMDAEAETGSAGAADAGQGDAGPPDAGQNGKPPAARPGKPSLAPTGAGG